MSERYIIHVLSLYCFMLKILEYLDIFHHPLRTCKQSFHLLNNHMHHTCTISSISHIPTYHFLLLVFQNNLHLMISHRFTLAFSLSLKLSNLCDVWQTLSVFHQYQPLRSLFSPKIVSIKFSLRCRLWPSLWRVIAPRRSCGDKLLWRPRPCRKVSPKME